MKLSAFARHAACTTSGDSASRREGWSFQGRNSQTQRCGDVLLSVALPKKILRKRIPPEMGVWRACFDGARLGIDCHGGVESELANMITNYIPDMF